MIPASGVAVLKRWFTAHNANPHPSANELAALAAQIGGGVTPKAIDDWFIATRKRLLALTGGGATPTAAAAAAAASADAVTSSTTSAGVVTVRTESPPPATADRKHTRTSSARTASSRATTAVVAAARAAESGESDESTDAIPIASGVAVRASPNSDERKQRAIVPAGAAPPAARSAAALAGVLNPDTLAIHACIEQLAAKTKQLQTAYHTVRVSNERLRRVREWVLTLECYEHRLIEHNKASEQLIGDVIDDFDLALRTTNVNPALAATAATPTAATASASGVTMTPTAASAAVATAVGTKALASASGGGIDQLRTILAERYPHVASAAAHSAAGSHSRHASNASAAAAFENRLVSIQVPSLAQVIEYRQFPFLVEIAPRYSQIELERLQRRAKRASRRRSANKSESKSSGDGDAASPQSAAAPAAYAEQQNAVVELVIERGDDIAAKCQSFCALHAFDDRCTLVLCSFVATQTTRLVESLHGWTRQQHINSRPSSANPSPATGAGRKPPIQAAAMTLSSTAPLQSPSQPLLSS